MWEVKKTCKVKEFSKMPWMNKVFFHFYNKQDWLNKYKI